MAKFEVKVVMVNEVIDHPNADKLSLVKIGGFYVVSAKLEDGSHRYKNGDLVVYVPENSLVPEYLLKRGFWDEKKNKGFLAGPSGNRVKPIKLRGILSEGILFPVAEVESPVGYAITLEDDSKHYVNVGDDVSDALKIVKWEPEVPSNMSGDLIGSVEPMSYDIENIKKYADVFYEGEFVYFTEKLHGTQVQFGWLIGENDDKYFDGQFFVTSKGVASKSLILKDTPENREKNLYVKSLLANIDNIKKLSERFKDNKKVIFFGEIFGKGVQDLNYNVQSPTFRIFDINVDGSFLNFDDLMNVCSESGIEIVPVNYVGPFSEEILKRETSGTTAINGAHLKEGVVVKPTKERIHPSLGRVILKSISEDYINRKGNTTEYN